MVVGTSAAKYARKAAEEAGGGMEPAVARKVLNARKLRGTMALTIIPMACESQGGLHPNWRATYAQWAAFWASKDKENRPSWPAFDGAVLDCAHIPGHPAPAVHHHQLYARLREAGQVRRRPQLAPHCEFPRFRQRPRGYASPGGVTTGALSNPIRLTPRPGLFSGTPPVL